MIVEEKFLVLAPIQKVWDFLQDPNGFGSCIPGCERIELVDKDNFITTVKVKVGPFSMRFNFSTTIKEANPPFFMRAAGDGEEANKMGRFRHETTIDFKSLSENETEISYRSEVVIVGKLATFGDRIMKAKAKDLGKEFAQAVEKHLGHH